MAEKKYNQFIDLKNKEWKLITGANSIKTAGFLSERIVIIITPNLFYHETEPLKQNFFFFFLLFLRSSLPQFLKKSCSSLEKKVGEWFSNAQAN